MRVIAGSARSIPLYPAKTAATRPLTDRVKTSLFSILDPVIPGARVGDFFAGVGSLGIEALSRGAASCVFVECDRACLRAIARNLERTKLADRAEVLAGDAWRMAEVLIERGWSADVVFLDPPFRYGQPPHLQRLRALARRIAEELLVPGGLLVYHHEYDPAREPAFPSLIIADRRRYGRNAITIFRNPEQ